MTQYYTFESRKERANNTIWKQWETKKSAVLSKDFLDANDCKPNDLIFDAHARVFRVDKVTPKMIMLSEYHGDNDFRNPKRMSHINFSMEYRPTNEKEMARIKQLGCRLQFIRKFEKVME